MGKTQIRKYYTPPNFDLKALADDMEFWLQQQCFQVQQIQTTDGALLLQTKQTAAWRKVAGMSTALNVVFRLVPPAATDGNNGSNQKPTNLTVEIGQGNWLDKGAAVTVGLFIPFCWPALVTAGIGANKQNKMPEQVFNFVTHYFATRPTGAGAGTAIEQQPTVMATNTTSGGAAPSAPYEQPTTVSGVPVAAAAAAAMPFVVSPTPSTSSSSSSDAEDMISKLERLAKLRTAGILTEEEFATQKATILSGN